ncbi:MAG: dihydropteroate synthase [Anaerolineales bacterium]|nr:dihydropteroate synthase [Anaerolineales bacterium]
MDTLLHSQTRSVTIGPDRPFVLIGERINPSGRKRLGAEMAAGDFSRVQRDAAAQVAAGAHVLDVNAGVPIADEAALLVAALRAVSEVTQAPLCLDSSVIEALAAGLAAYPGKALVNSVTGEDDRLEAVLPLVKKHGAAVIGMANDETGISSNPEYRLGVARKILQRAQDHGIAPEDVLIDPLALTVAADPEAVQVTLHTMRLIRDALGLNMVCGASNISFGLPDRSPLNAAFLSMAMVCGLTCAITDPTNPAIRQAVLASDVLLGHDPYAGAWIAHFRAQKAAASTP